MTSAPSTAPLPQLSLLEFLIAQGWKPVRDGGREEVAGLCPLHEETRPSFYVNRRKSVFYCHGCGRGGGLTRFLRLYGDLRQPDPAPETIREHAAGFYQQQLSRFPEASAYLTLRGIRDRAVIERMRIGYAPGACLRGHLRGLGIPPHAIAASGLVDSRGRDRFFRCLTFPLGDSGNLYGRAIGDTPFRHRFLPGSKGGLYGWARAAAFPRLIVVEGLFDVMALYQAGFPNTVAVLGTHPNAAQMSRLCDTDERLVYICFDNDSSGAGQRAALALSLRLARSGVRAVRVALPGGLDPAAFFASGATARDFERCLERARP